jgi:hypothetical protein
MCSKMPYVVKYNKFTSYQYDSFSLGKLPDFTSVM